MINSLYPRRYFAQYGPAGGNGNGSDADTGTGTGSDSGAGGDNGAESKIGGLEPNIPVGTGPCDFTLNSPCCQVIYTYGGVVFDFLTEVSNPQQFLDDMKAGWLLHGCNFFADQVELWSGIGVGVTNVEARLKIAWAVCMTDTPCCPDFFPIGVGCRDNGFMPNTYLNNWGTTGSLIPGSPALNYNPLATTDDGSCIYPEIGSVCGCNDPLSNNFIGNQYSNGHGWPWNPPPAPGQLSSTWSPDWNLHPGYFTDCAGNVRGSTDYLAIGPYGDTSCCNSFDDKLYNYRDVYVSTGTQGTNKGFFRGISMDGCVGSSGVDPTEDPAAYFGAYGPNSDVRFDGVIGLPWLILRPNLNDVHGNKWKKSDFHTSPDKGWTIQIYDSHKHYLGTWHYEKCIAYEHEEPFIDHTAGQQTTPPAHYNMGIRGHIKLYLYGVTHLDGPHPVVNYGNTYQQTTLAGIAAANQYNIVDLSYQPEYYQGNYHVYTASFAYIKITTDYNYNELSCLGQSGGSNLPAVTSASTVNNPFRLWFENIYTGPNTTVDQMNVVCFFPRYFNYWSTLQPQTSNCSWCPTINPMFNHLDLIPWGTIGTSGCIDPGAYSPSQLTPTNNPKPCDQSLFVNPHYGFSVLSHFLHPWAASHRQVPLVPYTLTSQQATWYENLTLGNVGCGGFRFPEPTGPIT